MKARNYIQQLILLIVPLPVLCLHWVSILLPLRTDRLLVTQPEELTAVLQRENESKACYERFLKHMQTHHYPSKLTLQMYMLFASHMNIGTPEILHFYQQCQCGRIMVGLHVL